MTGDKYIFNFEAAVEEARRDYPAETKHITFVDLSAPTAHKQLFDWHYADVLESYCHRLYPFRAEMEFEGSLPFPDPHNFDLAQAEAYFSQDPESLEDMRASAHAAADETLAMGSICHSAPSGSSKVLLGVETAPAQISLLEDRDKDLYFAFCHELGHAIVPGGRPELARPSLDDDGPVIIDEVANMAAKNIHEVTADTFGLLRALNKNVITLDDVKTIQQNRAWRAVIGDAAHFTAPQVETFYLKMKDADFISLSPVQISAIAQAHAALHPAPGEELMDLGEICTSFISSHVHSYHSAEVRDVVNGSRSEPQQSIFGRIQSSAFFRTQVAQYFNAVCRHAPEGSYLHTAADRIVKMAQSTTESGAFKR